MIDRRTLLIVAFCAGALLALAGALGQNGGLLRRLRARRVTETVLISAGNRRLAGFFDGLAPDPHFDARRALRSARGAQRPRQPRRAARLAGRYPRAQGLRAGLLSHRLRRLLRWLGIGPCPNCPSGTYTWNNTGTVCIAGGQNDGTVSCGGCVGQCNSNTCGNANCSCAGSGGCGDTGASCEYASDCCSMACLAGQCQDTGGGGGGCGATGSPCSSDSDCCSGSCDQSCQNTF